MSGTLCWHGVDEVSKLSETDQSRPREHASGCRRGIEEPANGGRDVVRELIDADVAGSLPAGLGNFLRLLNDSESKPPDGIDVRLPTRPTGVNFRHEHREHSGDL